MQHKIKLVLLLAFVAKDAFPRVYKHYLSVHGAERTLANIVQHPRISRDEWLSILGEKKNITYTVQPGDTLWRISQKTFGDPFLWRKLWQVNDAIANPHTIEPGRVLAYYRDLSEGEVPVIKLVPAGKGSLTDLDNDVVVHQTWVSRIRIMHFLMSPEATLGYITGSYSDKSLLSTTDRIYIHLDDISKVKRGDLLSLAREEKLVTQKQMPVIEGPQNLMRLLGQVEIIDIGNEHVVGEIKECFDTVERGDKIVNQQKTVMRTVAKTPPNEVYATIVSGEIPERKSFGQSELILLNKGLKDGLQESYLFRVYQDTDPEKKSRSTVEPHFKGEVQIVYAGEKGSVGYILRNDTPLNIGDILLPSQHFNSPTKRIYRGSQQVELED